ncbi:MAG: GntR family transcriptional regulator [Phycisphaerales bacterium]|nr:GntR family transcriptional regulator [Phycisphaerales bacterium]
MPQTFTKLSAAQQLARQIQRQVEDGVWSTGSSLPTVRELADRFQVSRTTVQNAIRELSDRAIIKRRHRQSSIITAPSATPKTKCQVGCVVGLDPSIHIPLWWAQQIIHHAQMALAESGYLLTLFNYWNNKPDYARQVIDQMSGMRDSLAGMCVFSCDDVIEMVNHFEQIDMPWMSVNPMSLETHHNFVMADQISAGRLVGRCFAKLGYERVALIFDDVQNASPLEKMTGVYQGYLLEGKSTTGIEQVICRNMETNMGYSAMKKHLATHQPPQGIFATSDTLAVGAMRACQEIGLRVPEDLGVIGSTGLPSKDLHSDPPLTEMRQPVEGVGRQLALCLLEMIRGDVRRISGRRVPSQLILKESLAIPDSICRELGIEPVLEKPAARWQPAEQVSTA